MPKNLQYSNLLLIFARSKLYCTYMKRLLSTYIVVVLAAVAGILSSCSKEKSEALDPIVVNPVEEMTEAEMKNFYINLFSLNELDLYYLWIDDDQIAAKMEKYKADPTADPIDAVRDIRFKDEAGNDIDRWTDVFDDYEKTSSSFQGVETTYGFNFQLYRYDNSTVCAVVTYVFKDGPAEKAGLKRGDIIVKVNGKTMPLADKAYVDIVYNELMDGSELNATLHGGKVVSLKSVTMLEDAVLLTKVFDCGGKKVGYMVYNSFTFESIDRLIEECKMFKAEGIKELILDLRYNGGGYGIANEALSSMLAPEADVKAGALFQTEVFNKFFTDYYKSKKYDTNIYFKTKFEYQSLGVKKTSSTEDANIGIDKLYVLVTGNSASASEALICCLKPYLPIVLIGQQTYGKYLGGYLLGAQDFYDNYKDVSPIKEFYESAYPVVKGWGAYVMVSRYADKDGKTGCMPDGFMPNIESDDDPLDGCPIGDPNETMLKVALTEAGYQYPAESGARTRAVEMNALDKSKQVHKRNFGLLIKGDSLFVQFMTNK